MGTLPKQISGVRLADASKVFRSTISVANTRRGYAEVLNRLVRGFGADGDVALLDPDRVILSGGNLAVPLVQPGRVLVCSGLGSTGRSRAFRPASRACSHT